MSVAPATTNWSRQIQHICPSSVRLEFSRRAVKQTHAEMLFKLRKPSGGCSLGRTVFSSDARKGSSLNHPHQVIESTRSIDFQKKFKSHSKINALIGGGK